MNSIFYNILSALFFLWSIRSILFWIHLWQIKEYRFDRLKAHLTETDSGKSILLGRFNIIKNLFFVLLFYFAIQSYGNIFIDFGILIIFLSSNYFFFQEIAKKRFKRPVLTLKTFTIFFLSFVSLFVLYNLPLIYKTYWIFVLERSIFFIVTFYILLLWMPSEILKNLIIFLATHRRSKYNKLDVIGITGSYGKTSTKECISFLFSRNFRTLATSKNSNTPYGISMLILNKLSSNIDFFVAELGAYRKGEIKELCDIVKPTYSVLTGINNQHESLFGSIEAIKEAKYEIINSLPYDGICLFNGNNQHVLELYNKTKRQKKILYYASYTKDYPKNADVVASDIVISKDSTSFTVKIAKNKASFRIKSKLLGRQGVESLLPAIYLTYSMKISIDVIQKLCLEIPQFSHRMELNIDELGRYIIDNTYNLNPDAVSSALEYLETFKGKKAVIMQPLIELGQTASVQHSNIGFILGKVCDVVFVTNSNFKKNLTHAIDEGSSANCKIFYRNPDFASEYLSNYFKKGDVIIFLGRESFSYFKKFNYK